MSGLPIRPHRKKLPPLGPAMPGADPQQELLRHLRRSARNFSKISGLSEYEALVFICTQPHNYCRLVDLSGLFFLRRAALAHVEQLRLVLAERWPDEASRSDPLIVELELIVSRLEYGAKMPPLVVRTSRRRARLLAQFGSVHMRGTPVLSALPKMLRKSPGESLLIRFSRPITVGLELGISASCCFYLYSATLLFRAKCSACGFLEVGVVTSLPPAPWFKLTAIKPGFFALSEMLSRLMI